MDRKKPHLHPSSESYCPPKSTSIDSTTSSQHETVNGSEMTMHQNTRRNNDNRQQAQLLALHAQTQSYPAYHGHPNNIDQYAPAVSGGPPGIGSPTSDSSTWGDGYTDENRPSTTTVRSAPQSFDPKEHLPYNGSSSPDTKYPSSRDNAEQALSDDGKALQPTMKDSQRPLSRSPPDSKPTSVPSYLGKPQSLPSAPANGAKHVTFEAPNKVYYQAPRAGHRRDDSNSSSESSADSGPETPAHMATYVSLPFDDAPNESKTVQNKESERTSSKVSSNPSVTPVIAKSGPPPRALPTPTRPTIAKELQKIVELYTNSSLDASQRFSQEPATNPPCSNMTVVIDGLDKPVHVSGDGGTITCERLIREVLRELQRKVTPEEMKRGGLNRDMREKQLGKSTQLSYFMYWGGDKWRLVLRASDE